MGSAGHDILVADDVASHFTEEALWQISEAWASTRNVGQAVDEILDEAVIDASLDQLTAARAAIGSSSARATG